MIHAYDELQLEKKNPVVSVVKLNSTVAYIRETTMCYGEKHFWVPGKRKMRGKSGRTLNMIAVLRC